MEPTIVQEVVITRLKSLTLSARGPTLDVKIEESKFSVPLMLSCK